MAYYRTPEGRVKKQQQNSKRYRVRRASPEAEGALQDGQERSPKETWLDCRRPETDEQQADAMKQRPDPDQSVGEQKSRSRFDREMVLYLAMVVSLVEGREVGSEEIEALLCRVVRQHSIARRRRLEYAVWYLSNRPP